MERIGFEKVYSFTLTSLLDVKSRSNSWLQEDYYVKVWPGAFNILGLIQAYICLGWVSLVILRVQVCFITLLKTHFRFKLVSDLVNNTLD